MTHKDQHKHQHEDAPGEAQKAQSTSEPAAPDGKDASPPDAQARVDAAAAPATDKPAAVDSAASLQAQRDDLLNRLQRVSADYLNYQKRLRKETDHSRQYANEDLIKAMLPVLDDIDLALETGSANHAQDDPLLAGLRLIRDKAIGTLAQFGLAPIESLGKPFDPDHHSAVTQQAAAEHTPGTVLKELRKGYSLKGRTIRPAMVMVSVAPEAGKEGG